MKKIGGIIKKAVSLILSALLVLCCFACSNNASVAVFEETQMPIETEIPTPAPTEAPTAAPEINYDMRKITWGMSLEEVRDSEDASKYITSDDTMLVYSDTFETLPIDVMYSFSNGKLKTIYYLFRQKHSNSELYIIDYDSIKASYIEKYGKPISDGELWIDPNSIYRDKNDRGRAIAKGDLMLMSKWRTESGAIELMLYGDNYKVEMSMTHSR